MENRVFSPISVHVNQIILTLDIFLTLGNFILTLENLGRRVNDFWNSGPRENPDHGNQQFHDQTVLLLQTPW